MAAVDYVASPEHPLDEWYTIVCEEKQLGINIAGIEVVQCKADGWASRNGVTLDDEVFTVDGVQFGKMSRSEKMTALTGKR